MSDPYEFITFGCWGELNNDNPPVYNVLTSVSQYCVNNKDCKFIIITGDNYYSMKIDKGNKILYVDRLEKAFDALLNTLPINIDIYLLLGNHDLANDIGEVKTEQTDKPHDNAVILNKKPEDCIILKTEIDIINSRRTHNIKFPNKLTMHYIKNKTLFLMIDTTMYDIHNDLSLLKQELTDKIHCYSELDKNLTNMENILNKQLEEILYIINNIEGEIKNVVISGHHPLIETKIKKNKKNKETKETTETTKPTVRIKALMKSYELLNEIYNKFRDTVKYYYLCADYHCYQEGVIKINMTSTDVMSIQHYVVGTGGAELDAAVSTGIYEVDKNIVYNVTTTMSINGFLVCKSNIEDILSFEFHEAFKFHEVLNTNPKGGKNKPKTRKIHKKKGKSSKKNRNKNKTHKSNRK